MLRAAPSLGGRLGLACSAEIYGKDGHAGLGAFFQGGQFGSLPLLVNIKDDAVLTRLCGEEQECGKADARFGADHQFFDGISVARDGCDRFDGRLGEVGQVADSGQVSHAVEEGGTVAGGP